MKPRYDLKAIHTAKRRLTDMIGLPSLAAFVGSRGGWLMSNLAKILPAELARLEAGGTPATASTPAAPRQLIRLGSGGLPAAVPTKPATAPKPPVHQFIPAPKPTTPPAKPSAPGARSGALSISEAESLALKVFPNCTTAMNTTEVARWASLENVFKANGHSAPWRDDKGIGIPSDKLAGHSARQAKISKVFETGFTRAEFSKLSARDQSDFCKNGGQLRD